MTEAEHFWEKQRRCLRLASAIDAGQAREGIMALAAEYEAKAQAAEAEGRSAALLGDGEL